MVVSGTACSPVMILSGLNPAYVILTDVGASYVKRYCLRATMFSFYPLRNLRQDSSRESAVQHRVASERSPPKVTAHMDINFLIITRSNFKIRCPRRVESHT